MRIISVFLLSATIAFFIQGCNSIAVENSEPNFKETIQYCKDKLAKSCRNFNETQKVPRVIHANEKNWTGSSINSWTSGFYAGMMWLMYDYTGDEYWKQNAAYYTGLLEPVKRLPWKTHDFGFMIYYSYGLGHKFTSNPSYMSVLLETADSLATLYNPRVGAMESWPWMKQKKGWPHTTIIDNMMNLELLFWAAAHGGKPYLKEIAINHARKTLEDFVRPDYSTVHIVVYDSLTGDVLQVTTDQGNDARSTWARGQSWAAYGFIKTFQYSGEHDFLNVSIKLADYYLENVPEDLVPYWDFNAPLIPNEPRDASAAAIMSSALLDISAACENTELKGKYYEAALKILATLSTKKYMSDESDAFLKGSIGSKPGNSEVGVSLIYTDYYFLEALLKAGKMRMSSTFAGSN